MIEVDLVGDGTFQRILDCSLKRLLENEPENNTSEIRVYLSRIVKKAKRQNVWRKFSGLGKNFMGLCISLPIKFRGKEFLRALVKTLKELMLLISPVYRFWSRGRDLSFKICRAAHDLGNQDALNWKNDRNFTIYWGMVLSSSPFGSDRC